MKNEQQQDQQSTLDHREIPMKNEQQQGQQSTLDHGKTHLLGNKTWRLLWQHWHKRLIIILIYIGAFIFLVAIGRSPLAVMIYLIIAGVGSLLVRRRTTATSKEGRDIIMESLFIALTIFIFLTGIMGHSPLVAMISSIFAGVMYWFGLRLTTSYQRR